MKTRNCADCALADMTGSYLRPLVCAKGHKPRFYRPIGPYPYSDNWGWKRKCGDFSPGTPVGITKIKINI